MASNIKFKRSAVQNRVPTTSQLDLGELALNTYDGKLYTEINTGSAAVVEIGSKLSSLVVDGANGGGGGDVVFHGTTAGRDLTWDYSDNALEFADNVSAVFGSRMSIKHTGSHAFIDVFGAGNLILESQNTTALRGAVIDMTNAAGSVYLFQATVGGSVDLYHSNAVRIATTADGADISGTGSLKIPVGTTAQRSSSPTNGDLRYNTTTGGFEGYSNNNWGELGGGGIGIGSTAINPASGLVTNRIGVGFTDINVVGTGISVTGYGSTIVLDFNDFKPGSFNRSIHNYTATAGQTTFAGLSYDNAERQIAVYLNGARLSEATYTATSGTTVVLDVGASVGDEVEIINININSDVDRNVNTYTATAGQTTFTGLSYNSSTELDVYLNGIRLASADYTATSGNTVVLAVGASVNDIVDIVSTGDGVSFRSTTDASGDRFTLSNVGIGTDQTPDALDVRGNVNIVGVLTATTLHGDGQNLTNTGSSLSEPSSGTQRIVTTSLTSGTMTSSGTGSELTFDYANNKLIVDGDIIPSSHGSGRLGTNGGGSPKKWSQAFFTGGVFIDDSTTGLSLGSGFDTKLYHNGSNSTLDHSGTGNFLFRSNNGIMLTGSTSGGKVMANFTPDGSVDLYHANSKKFETTAYGTNTTGIAVNDGLVVAGVTTATGTLNSTGGIILTGNMSVASDTAKVFFGASNDLSIYHNGSHSYIDDTGTGNLKVRSNNFRVSNADDSKISATFVPSGAVELYHDNDKKFQTQASGAKIFNTASSGGTRLEIQGQEGQPAYLQLNADDGDDNADYSRIYHGTDGSVLFQNFTSGSWETNIKTTGNGSTDLFYDNGLKFQTKSDGVKLYQGHFYADDSSQIRLGSGQDLRLYHDGTDSHVNNYTGTFYIQAANNLVLQNTSGDKYIKAIEDGTIELYYNNSKKFETTSAGAKVFGDLVVDGNLTNEDVTTISSVGIITAQNGINVTSGDITMSTAGNIVLGDSGSASDDRIAVGAGGDIHIYHDGTNSYVSNATGDLNLFSVGGSADDVIVKAQDDIELQPNNGQSGVKVIGAGAVELYHNNSKKIETTSSGISVTGQGVFSSAITASTYIQGTSGIGGLKFYSDSSASKGVILNTDDHLVPSHDSNSDLGLNGTRWRNVYADTLYGDGSNLTGITQTTINSNADNRVITGSGTANTLNAESGLLWSGTTLTVSGSTNQKIILQGATHPYIHFYEGTTGKAFIQWHADGYMRIKNDEDDATIRLKDNIEFSPDDSTYYKMWHAGNDGSGSGLDADTLDGVQGSSFLRSDANDSASGQITHTNKVIIDHNNSPMLELKPTNSSPWVISINRDDLGESRVFTHNPSSQGVGWVFEHCPYFYNSGNYNKFLSTANEGSGNGLDADTVDGIEAVNLLRSDTNDTMDGNLTFAAGHVIRRADNKSGFFEGLHGAGSNNDTHSNPIYTIGPNYNPALTTLGNMYGIGYTHGGNSSFGPGGSWGMYVAADGDARIFLDATYGRMYINDGNTYITEGDGNAIRVQTNSGYIDVGAMNSSYAHFQTDRNQFYFNKQVIVDGNLAPYSNNNYNLGSSSTRWANIYVNDLQLSNEAKKDTGGNDVDGTWGDWTLQEGEEEVFMINNRTGKKYAMMLREVK